MEASVCYSSVGGSSSFETDLEPKVRGYSSATLRQIVEQTVADVFDVDCDNLRLPTRGQARVALARQVAMYIAHVGCGINLTDVGIMFNRDRTTVSHACEVVEKRRDDSKFDHAIDLIELVVRVLIGPNRIGSGNASL